MTTYRVTFDRIGRNRNVEPLTVNADSADGLAEKIYHYAKPHLVSRGVDISVDLETGKGFIFAGFNNGGTFTVKTVTDPDGASATTLYPTKTRVALLLHVAAGNVIEHSIDDDAYVDPGAGETPYKVTARLAELEAAGWVELPEGTAIWAITPAGQQQLSEATS